MSISLKKAVVPEGDMVRMIITEKAMARIILIRKSMRTLHWKPCCVHAVIGCIMECPAAPMEARNRF